MAQRWESIPIALIIGISSVIPKKSLWSRFCTTMSGSRPDDAVIDLTTISTLGVTTKFNSFLDFQPIFLSNFVDKILSIARLSFSLLPPRVTRWYSFERIMFYVSLVSFSASFSWVLYQSQNQSNWLSSLLICCVISLVETMIVMTTVLTWYW